MSMHVDMDVPDYYALFQISPQASQMDVINGYRYAKQAYQQESLAAYSLYSNQDLEDIQDQIEEAYRVLSDPEKRRSYDILYQQSNPADEEEEPAERSDNVVPIGRKDSHRTNPSSESAGVAPVNPAGIFSGLTLRQIREEKAILLESISEHTKISLRYLRAIEEEDLDRFPETAYLKGYLRQYCGEIGVDADRVLGYYLTLVNDDV